jgi:RNA polymerase-binding transcription factor DksA
MATTADILGLARKRSVPAQWKKLYQRLCAERDRLSERNFHTPAGTQVKTDDLAETGTEESDRSLLLVTANATQTTIHEVLDAINRIERGTYGICEVTGQPIEMDRMEAIPWTRYSIQGQQELEKQGLANRLALPQLNLVSEETDESEEEKENEKEESGS